MCERNPEISNRIIGDIVIHEYEGAKKPACEAGQQVSLGTFHISK